jgi:teichuronic acid biosynthesis glycosyltransferase TuaC
MRVLVVTNMYPTSGRPGLGIFVRDQVEALRSVPDMQIELFALDPSGPRSYVGATRALRRFCRDRHFDVVHAHYGLSAWVCMGAKVLPDIVTFHGTDLAHPLVKPLSRLASLLCRLPATASADLARTSGLTPSLLGTRHSLAVLPCGINMHRFTPRDKQLAREQLGLSPNQKYLLFPADPARSAKRYDRARSVCAKLDDCELLALENVSPQQVPYFINACDAVVIPSEREGFGLAVLEALACNVPVLATPTGVAPLALSGVAGTLCEPFDAERWATALAPHLKKSDPRVFGRDRAAMFECEHMARRLVCAYTSVAEPNKTH